MNMCPRPWREAVETCLLALVLFIACDKSYQLENPVPMGSDLYTKGPYKYPAREDYNVTRCQVELTCWNRCERARESSDLYCQCDQLCWVYGDCCVDYYSMCLGVDVADPDSVVLRAILAQMRSYYDFLRFYGAMKWARLSSCQKLNEQYIRVVRACGSDQEVRFKFERLREKLSQPGANETTFLGISSADIVYECENRLTDDDRVTLPVSLSKDHTVHFYNVFCAICNGIDPHDTLAWNVSIRYKNVTSGKLSNVQRSIKRVFQMSTTLDRRWCIQYRGDLLGKVRRVPSSTENEAESDLLIDAAYGLCQPTDPVSSDFSLCGRFLRPYLAKAREVKLNNQYCVLCNGANETISCLTEKCVCPESNQIITPYSSEFPVKADDFTNLPNLKDLFYFRDQSIIKLVNETTISIKSKTCPENQVFSRFYDQCVDVVCPDGANATQGRCPDATASCRGGKDPCDGDAGRTIAESVPYPRGSTTVSLVFVIQRVTDLNGVAMDHDKFGVEKGQNKFRVIRAKIDTNASLVTRGALDSMPETSTSFTSTKSNSKPDIEKTDQADDRKSKVNPVDLGAFMEFPLSLQSMRSIWISQISTMGSWNFTETFTEIWRNIHVVRDNTILMKAVQFSIKTTESCPEAGIGDGHGNSSSPACRQYIDVRFSYNDSRSSNAILSLVEEEILPRVMDSAHTNNHVLTDVRLTNYDFQTTDLNSAGVCGSGRRAENIIVNVTADGNGTYTARADGFTAHPIDHFKFSLAVMTDETTGDIRLRETAEVVVCAVNNSTPNCSMVFYASSDIVEYEGRLIITRRADELLRFLRDSTARRGASLSEILQIFYESNNTSDIEVHQMGMYVISHSGAYVCSDYSRNYSVRNETVVQVSRRFRTMSDSVPERIATVLSFAVSITCLVAVLIVYGLVPELRNTPGKIVMSMSGTLLLAQVMLLCSAYPKGLACDIYAAVQHAAWLSSSAWLAAMAAHLRHVLYSKSKSDEKSMFGLLAFLCWGLPSVLAGSCFTLDRIGLVDLEYDSGQKCWLNNTYIMIFAFGVPLFFLVTATFICGACIVRAIQKSSEFVNKATKDRHRVRGQLLLCINIALLMGLGWAIYFIAMLADTEVVWVLFILANGSQGLFVFLCYAAKRSVVMTLVQRWRHRPAVSSEFTSANGGSTWTVSKK